MSITSPKSRRLSETRFRPKGYMVNEWEIEVESGTTIENILNPIFWTHVAKNLCLLDEIKILTEDRTFYARVLVTGVDKQSARVFVLEYKDLTEAEAFQPSEGLAKESDYLIEYAGKTAKWRVVRLADRKTIKSGMESREEAERSMRDHIKILTE